MTRILNVFNIVRSLTNEEGPTVPDEDDLIYLSTAHPNTSMTNLKFHCCFFAGSAHAHALKLMIYHMKFIFINLCNSTLSCHKDFAI